MILLAVPGFLWPDAVVFVVGLVVGFAGTACFCLVPFIIFENYKIFTHLLIIINNLFVL